MRLTTYSEPPSGANHIGALDPPVSPRSGPPEPAPEAGARAGSMLPSGPMIRLAPLALLAASCVPAPGPAEAGGGPELAAAVEAMYDDLSSRRWEALATHFLPDATIVFSTPTGPNRKTRSEFIEMVSKKVEGLEIFEERMESAWVRVYGDIAIVWSKFEGKEGTKEKVRTWSGIDAFTLMKDKGAWRISQVAVYVDRPDPKK
jgi:hypothetical protein